MDWYARTRQQVRTDAEPDGALVASPVAVAVVWWRAEVLAQRARLFVWATVAFISGLLAYFALPVEPPRAVAMVLMLAVTGISLLTALGRAPALACLAAFVLAGMAWGQINVALNPVTMLLASTGKVGVTGWVDELSPPSRGRRKLVTRDVKVPALLP